MGGPPTQWRFVGRAVELERLEAALARAAIGSPAIVLLGGEAGIGKSTLLTEWERRAEARGALVLVGRCLDAGRGGYPFAPFIEILRTLLRQAEPGTLPALLGPARADLARLLPELAVRMGIRTEPEADPPTLARARLFERILNVVEHLVGPRLVVIALEDLQRIDDASLELLAFLASSVRVGRVQLVVTFRTAELTRLPAVLEVVTELAADHRTQRLELARFTRSEVRMLVAQGVAGSPDVGVADRIAARTGGNPFYVAQIVAAQQEGDGRDLPPRLRDVLRSRIAALSADGRAALALASVGGARLDDRLLERVARDPAALRAGLREALDRGLLVRVGERVTEALEFSHGLLQEAVYGDLLPSERIAHHLAFARALDDDPSLGAAGESVAAERARHWDAAGVGDRACLAGIEAAARASEVYAFGDASRQYQRVLELIDRLAEPDAARVDHVAVLHGAAEAAALAGDYGRAVELGRSAVEVLDATPEPTPEPATSRGRLARRAMLHERLRWYLWETGDVAGAAAAIEDAVRLIPADPPTAARARALGHLAGTLMFAGRYDASRPIALEALAVGRACGALAEVALAQGVLAWDFAALGDPDAGIHALREGHAIATLLGRPEGIALGHANVARLLEFVGRADEARDEAMRGLDAVREIGLARTYGAALAATAAAALFDLGRWGEAAQLAQEAASGIAAGIDAAWVQLVAGRVALGHGDREAARRHLDRARSVRARVAAAFDRPRLAAAIARLELADGDLDAARAAVADALTGEAAGMADPSGWRAELVAIGMQVEADAAESARARRNEAAVAEAQARGRSLLAAWPLDASGPWGRVAIAEMSRLDGHSSAAGWAAAAEAARAAARPALEAVARFREAEAALAATDRRAAEAPLRAAHRIAAELGAAALLADIARLARIGRIQLDGDATAPSSPAERTANAIGLTPREQEVLRLVAAGRSNREIGEALFITRKTASVHVSNILSKLGASGRTEAAAIAYRLGLSDDALTPEVPADRP